MEDLAQTYLDAVESFIGKGRIVVRPIHSDKELCINSREREILETIRTVQRNELGVEWTFRENLYGMALTVPVAQLVAPRFADFSNVYKERFRRRIQMIIDRYDTKPLTTEKSDFYQQVKASYAALHEDPVVDFDEYKKVRDLFERVRY